LVVDAHVQPVEVGLQRVPTLGEGGVDPARTPVVHQRQGRLYHPLLHETRDVRAGDGHAESVVAFVENVDAVVDIVTGVDHADVVVRTVVDVEGVGDGRGPKTLRPDQHRRQQRPPAHVDRDVDEPR